MLGFYIPMAFLLDRYMFQRYVPKEAQKKRAEREAQRTGARQAEGLSGECPHAHRRPDRRELLPVQPRRLRRRR